MTTQTVQPTVLLPKVAVSCGENACAPTIKKSSLSDEMVLDSALLLLFIGDVALLSLIM